MRQMTRTERWTMLAAILGSAAVFLDGTIVNVALPKMGEELPRSIVGLLEGQTYVTSGYLATLAALLILAGALADYYGRRRIFTIGLAGFGLASILCGLAPSLELMVLFRLFQGAAGALLVPGSLAILTATFDGPARGRAIGIWAAATSATTPLGQVVGGFLVDSLSWRLAFLINVPIVLLALYGTVRHMPESRDETASGQFDWSGAAVAAIAVGGLAFGAIRGQDQQWRDPIAFAALGIGAVALVAFPLLMLRSDRPLVPLGLFRIRNFAVINLATLLIYGALYLVFSFQSLFLQGILGYTAQAVSFIGLPSAAMLTLLSARIGSIAGRVGARPFLVAGPLLMAAGLLWLARIPATSDPWLAAFASPSTLVPPVGTLVDVLPSILLFGLGISCVVAPLTTTLMSSVPVRNSGLASAINNAMSRVGQPLLSAIIFIVVSASFYATLASAVPGLNIDDARFRATVSPLNRIPADTGATIANAARIASTDAFHLAMIVAAVLLIAGAVVNLVGLRAEAPTSAVESQPEPTTA
jgi:EmrB/QacA subfamily drug resistance transporter